MTKLQKSFKAIKYKSRMKNQSIITSINKTINSNDKNINQWMNNQDPTKYYKPPALH